MSIFGRYRVSTFQIIAFGFFAMIMIGTLLLMLPVSSISHQSAGFADCLFTATSAVCVTGLVVRDTATYWSPFGQAVILLLIQIGGMGVVTTAVSLAFISGRRIGLLQRSVMQESISAPQVGGIIRLTRFIVLTALAIEGIGSALLLPVFIRELGVGKGVWYAVFHAVSAFCNAGFDLMGISGEFSSMTGYAQNALINVVMILLITIGGIGFLVWNDIRQNGSHWKHYRMQSKLVLSTSGILILLPFLWFSLHEMKGVLVQDRILPSLFQSVTLRTAGFNTVDLNSISSGGHGLMILCMLIGGSPGSTAGGVKTTTIAVMLLTARTVFCRREEVSCFGRRIGADTVRSAVAILTMYLMLFFAGGMVISIVEGLPLLTCLFETASALGTVGLSLGITARIGMFSRGILIVLMFLGRVGGLTLIYAAQASRKSACSTLPLEKLTVG
ncbi:MAG: Trk family potassium uptake protein [Clostridiales bacterium]|nr:Trk family potassium uptake protein [Clostridiales bacterium]